MSEKRYYWIKLNRDFFNTNEVKYLMSKVGDIGILTYQKLILYSADSDGKIEIKGLFDGDISKEIALYVNAEPEHVEAVFDALEELGMIAKNPDSITISGVSEMVGSETDKAHMMRKKRASGNNVTKASNNVTNESNNVTRERDRERDRDRIKEKEIKRKDCETVVSYFNETCVSLPRVSKISDVRERAINARLKENGMETVKAVIDKVRDSDFLNGKNDKGWTASIDWIVKPANFQKILEGCYDNRSGTEKHSRHEVFKGHTQKEYLSDPLGGMPDFDALENEMQRMNELELNNTG